MPVRWTVDAADDLGRICDYVAAIGQRLRDELRSTSYVPSTTLTHFRTEGALDAWRRPANSC